MKKVISIGINSAKGLTPLGAAVSGAKEFNNWAGSQGYETILFTDENGNAVTQNEIFTEIDNCIEAKKYEQIIIFFSGHGILKSPNQEIWLLSNAKSNPNESINLTLSIDYARTCGIPYVVFVSDACRILPAELQLTGNGSAIFPIMDDTNQDCAIDIFYATRPGSPAYEINSEESSKKVGIFTQSLLEVLQGKYPDLILSNIPPKQNLTGFYNLKELKKDISYKELSPGSWEIYSTSLDQTLKSLVKKKANLINLSLNQNPEIRVEHQVDKPFLARFDDITAKELLLNPSNKTSKDFLLKSDLDILIGQDFSEGLELNVTSLGITNFQSVFHYWNFLLYQSGQNRQLIKHTKKIYNSNKESRIQMRTGFIIIGYDFVQDVIVKNNQRTLLYKNGGMQINIDDETISSALIILENRESIPLAVLEGYIGTLVFEKGRLLTVNYTPSGNNNKYQDFKNHEKEINYVRAFIASAANEGFDYKKTFEKEFNHDGGFRFGGPGGFLRREKSLDPSLGLYAVYAYRQSGKLKEIRSVYNFMRQEPGALIFDVVMLANHLKDDLDRIAPFCPMLSLGWAYKELLMKNISPVIKEASLFLIPNLWTTFSEEGTNILKNAIQQNHLQ